MASINYPLFPTLAGRVLRHSPWDGLLIALSCVHAALLLTVPSVPLVAIGLWWNANTVSHNFIHQPFFRSRRANRAYSLWLSVLLGVPQCLWRARHLRHHAFSRDSTPYVARTALRSGSPARTTVRSALRTTIETAVILALWATIAAVAPRLFLLVYLPDWAAGLGLCFLQGHFEHARGTTSHYGRLYNLLFFNDGYHLEHHERPGVHWTQLPAHGLRGPHSSRWPPVLRWLEVTSLDWLERVVLHSATLQRFVLNRHAGALSDLLETTSGITRVTIVGGGLFPRTALILRRLLPDATLTVVDTNAANLETARTFLDARVAFVNATYDAALADPADLVVIPLAFIGDRARLYSTPPARHVLVHDWIWSSWGESARVSWLLAKRINLVRR